LPQSVRNGQHHELIPVVLPELVDAAACRMKACPRSGDSFRREVLVRNKLLVMAAIVVATIGTTSAVTAGSPAAAASGPGAHRAAA
jgi:hypothetical protein